MINDLVDRASRQRVGAAQRVVEAASDIDRAASGIAARLRSGATLHPVGTDIAAIDAAHVTVEFIHPVIVGKRAVPALTLPPEQVGLASPGAVVLGLRSADDHATGRALDVARGRGCLTVDLRVRSSGQDASSSAEHVIDLVADDPLIGRELQVTCYHVLWEMVHEYLDASNHGSTEAPADLGALYPFLYENGPADGGPLSAHVVASIAGKASDIARLRSEVLESNGERLDDVAQTLRRTADSGGTIWTFGNGGSSTDAQATAHLLRSDALDGTACNARSLTDDVATITALANDVNFDAVFARMLRSLARAGDAVVAFSTSGGSVNVLEGIEAASRLGATTVGFAGYDGGDMGALDALDHLFVVPSSSVHRIQEAQTTMAHVLITLTRGETRR